MITAKVDNHGVLIHYLDSIDEADLSLAPVILCPGLSEIAEEYEAMMKFLLPRRSIVLSFRGRGQSDTPPSGYGLEEHVSDIEAVVNTLGISTFHLFSYSRGVSYSLGYFRAYSERILSIIVEDYPSEHRAMPKAWQEHYINDYLIPHGRLDINIRAEAVYGIQKESKQEDIAFKYNKSMLIIRGLLEGALVTKDYIADYKAKYPLVTVIDFPNCSHGIKEHESEQLFNIVKDFLNQHK